VNVANRPLVERDDGGSDGAADPLSDHVPRPIGGGEVGGGKVCYFYLFAFSAL
jgi:hypothetical protein